jgi:tight adherence protein B
VILLTSVLVTGFLLLLTYRPGPGPSIADSVKLVVNGRPWRRTSSRSQRLAELVWLDALIGELTVGRDPISALTTACESEVLVARDAWIAARTGGDVAAALMATRSDVVRSAGACWLVAATSGAGLVRALTSIADSAREHERILQQIDIAVAEPRAAAMVVAVLPIIGLGMGSLLGSSPLTWLIATTIGRCVLASALALEVIGSWWAWRIIRGVAEPV